MSTPNTDAQVLAEDASLQVYTDLFSRRYFAKLASVGIVPATEPELHRMLDAGLSLLGKYESEQLAKTAGHPSRLSRVEKVAGITGSDVADIERRKIATDLANGQYPNFATAVLSNHYRDLSAAAT